MNKKLFVISGCSGVGKGTVISEFMKRNPKDFVLSVSCTTRQPRQGEQHGVNYFFLTIEEFEKNIIEEKFLEHAQFAGNHYGTKEKYIRQMLDDGYNVILEIETQGALQVKQKMPEAVLIFIAPPGVDRASGDISGGLKELENRLRGRRTEDESTIQKRLAQVKTELERSKFYDYTVINDDILCAVQEIEKITQKELGR